MVLKDNEYLCYDTEKGLREFLTKKGYLPDQENDYKIIYISYYQLEKYNVIEQGWYCWSWIKNSLMRRKFHETEKINRRVRNGR